MKFEWETIHATSNNINITVRAKVIGGWIVKNRLITHNTPVMNLVFIPDAEHKWEITNEDKS